MKCYVETSNLDGESNLKRKQCVPLTLTVDAAKQDEAFAKIAGTKQRPGSAVPEHYELSLVGHSRSLKVS